MIKFNKYIIKEYPTCRIGRAIIIANKESEKLLNGSCFDEKKCWTGTTVEAVNLRDGRRAFEFCVHNLTHIDRPSHIYADQLIDEYEEKIKKLATQTLRLVVARNIQELKKIGLSIVRNRNGALLLMNKEIKDGIPIFSDDEIDLVARLGFVAVLTNCLSIDPLDFPASSPKSNHYRFMKKGIIIIERVSSTVTGVGNIRIIRGSKINLEDDAEIVEIVSI